MRPVKFAALACCLIIAACGGRNSTFIPVSHQAASSQHSVKPLLSSTGSGGEQVLPDDNNTECAPADFTCQQNDPQGCLSNNSCDQPPPISLNGAGGAGGCTTCDEVATTTPAPGLNCDNSQFVLGTSNLPGDSQKATTVVNIWSFEDGVSPEMWFYQTENGQIWSQANPDDVTVLSQVLNALKPVPGLGSVSDWLISTVSLPKAISNTDYLNLKNTFVNSPYQTGTSIHHCFSNALPLG